MKRNYSSPKFRDKLQKEVDLSSSTEMVNSLFCEFKLLMTIIEARLYNSKKNLEGSSKRFKAYEILNSNNLFLDNMNSEKFYCKVFLNRCV